MERTKDRLVPWSFAQKHTGNVASPRAPTLEAPAAHVQHHSSPARTSSIDLLYHTCVPTEGYYKTAIHEKREALAYNQFGRQEVGKAPKAPYVMQPEFDPAKNKTFPGFGLPSSTSAAPLPISQFEVLANQKVAQAPQIIAASATTTAPMSARRQNQRTGLDSDAIKMMVFGGDSTLTRIGKLSTATQRHADPAHSADAADQSPPRTARNDKPTVSDLLRPQSAIQAEKVKSAPVAAPAKEAEPSASPPKPAVAAMSSAGRIIYSDDREQRDDLFAQLLGKDQMKRLLTKCASDTNKFGDVVQKPHVFEMVWNEAMRIEASRPATASTRQTPRGPTCGNVTSVNSIRKALQTLNV